MSHVTKEFKLLYSRISLHCSLRSSLLLTRGASQCIERIDDLELEDASNKICRNKRVIASGGGSRISARPSDGFPTSREAGIFIFCAVFVSGLLILISSNRSYL